LWCGEEDLFCSGVYEVFEKVWWQRWTDRVIEFAVMDIGVIYLELWGVVVIVSAGVGALILFVWRRRRIGVSRTASSIAALPSKV